MQVEAKAKWQQSSFNKNESQGLSLKGLLLQILIYSGVLVNLILPFYDFKSNGFPVVDQSRAKLGETINAPDALNNINALNRAQQAYFKETGYFSDSIEKLGVGIRDTERYSYRILSPMSENWHNLEADMDYWGYNITHRVLMIAQAKDTQYKSYLGMVYTLQPIPDFSQQETRKDMSEAILRSQVCEIDSRTLTLVPYIGSTGLNVWSIQCLPRHNK